LHKFIAEIVDGGKPLVLWRRRASSDKENIKNGLLFCVPAAALTLLSDPGMLHLLGFTYSDLSALRFMDGRALREEVRFVGL
jgi:hypothetical protein